MKNWIAWKSRTKHEKKGLRLMGFLLVLFIVFFGGRYVYPAMTGKFDERIKQDCTCNCPDYVKKELIEYQYEQLIRPMVVEAVGFQGMVLRDSIGTVFVITDDKALHEVLQYSYNVGDTIK